MFWKLHYREKLCNYGPYWTQSKILVCKNVFYNLKVDMESPFKQHGLLLLNRNKRKTN